MTKARAPLDVAERSVLQCDAERRTDAGDASHACIRVAPEVAADGESSSEDIYVRQYSACADKQEMANIGHADCARALFVAPCRDKVGSNAGQQ